MALRWCDVTKIELRNSTDATQERGDRSSKSDEGWLLWVGNNDNTEARSTNCRIAKKRDDRDLLNVYLKDCLRNSSIAVLARLTYIYQAANSLKPTRIELIVAFFYF